ncbi:unnamed protein product [Moneuplotes crassus]|uniref:Large ribosomal subunit protein mL43 n=1 Tax=Euplotes crassus TaxID=5936 RepID=A0AAD1Y1Q6_EUPCR|nr:unnamed protein product [Moneuplotes crassus]
MSVKGIRQLKSIRLYFCDFGGSSRGTRDVLKSQSLADFVKKGSFNMDIFMRRGHHPYFSATYINGFVKDIPLRNLEEEEIMQFFKSSYNSFGRRPLKHNINEVSNDIETIQGKWHDDIWKAYESHEMEDRKVYPELNLTHLPDVPRKKIDRKPSFYMKQSRKKDKIPYPKD